MPTGKPTAAERKQKGRLLTEREDVRVYYFEGTDRPWGVIQRGIYPWRYATWDAARRTAERWIKRGWVWPLPERPLRARQNNVDLALAGAGKQDD